MVMAYAVVPGVCAQYAQQRVPPSNLDEGSIPSWWCLMVAPRVRRSLRLEIIIVLLIAFEIAVTIYQVFTAQRGH